ncbi:MAG: aminodeoxychorismate lyase [Pseudomonadota bacterium]
MTRADSKTLVNGRTAEVVPIDDRGFRYGDGVFETIAVRNGAPEFWLRHLQRLRQGAARLGIAAPAGSQLAEEAKRLLEPACEGVLRIWLTRGRTDAGKPESPEPTRVLRLSPFPNLPDVAEKGVRARLCQTRLGRNPALAGIKHMNRLEQVLAAREWTDTAIAEGLMLDTDGNLVEGTKTNVFFVNGERLLTPELRAAGVAGVLREVVLEEVAGLKLTVEVRPIALAEALGAEACFLTNSLIHLWPVCALEERRYAIPPLLQALAARVRALAEAESGF